MPWKQRLSQGIWGFVDYAATTTVELVDAMGAIASHVAALAYVTSNLVDTDISASYFAHGASETYTSITATLNGPSRQSDAVDGMFFNHTYQQNDAVGLNLNTLISAESLRAVAWVALGTGVVLKLAGSNLKRRQLYLYQRQAQSNLEPPGLGEYALASVGDVMQRGAAVVTMAGALIGVMAFMELPQRLDYQYAVPQSGVEHRKVVFNFNQTGILDFGDGITVRYSPNVSANTNIYYGGKLKVDNHSVVDGVALLPAAAATPFYYVGCLFKRKAEAKHLARVQAAARPEDESKLPQLSLASLA